MRLSRFFLWALLATVVMTVLSPVAMPLFSLPPAAFGQAFGAGWIIVAYLAVGLGCASVYENGRTARLMLSGILVGGFAAVGWVLTVFVAGPLDIMIWVKTLVWPSTWMCFVMLTGLLMLVPAGDELRLRGRRVAIGLLAAFGLYVCLAYAFYPDRSAWEYENNALRLGAALGLLAGGAVLGSFLISWLSWVSGDRRREADPVPYWILCPRCGHDQELLTGHACCSRCGLRVRLVVS